MEVDDVCRSIQRPALGEVYQTLKIHHKIAQDQVRLKLIPHPCELCFQYKMLLHKAIGI